MEAGGTTTSIITVVQGGTKVTLRGVFGGLFRALWTLIRPLLHLREGGCELLATRFPCQSPMQPR
jgi:hypothetical protein